MHVWSSCFCPFSYPTLLREEQWHPSLCSFGTWKKKTPFHFVLHSDTFTHGRPSQNICFRCISAFPLEMLNVNTQVLSALVLIVVYIYMQDSATFCNSMKANKLPGNCHKAPKLRQNVVNLKRSIHVYGYEEQNWVAKGAELLFEDVIMWR